MGPGIGTASACYTFQMYISRRSRLVAAVIALLGMLFMQLAVASYACPTTPGPDVSTMVMHNAADADMPGCAGMDTEQPSLCHPHFQTGTQSLDKPDLPQVQPFVAVGLTMVVLPMKPAVPDAVIGAVGNLTGRTTAPPLAIRNCCFRI